MRAFFIGPEFDVTRFTIECEREPGAVRMVSSEARAISGMSEKEKALFIFAASKVGE